MKTRVSQSRRAGSALLVCLVTVALIGVSIASYLKLVKSQNLFTMRSQQWNSAVPVIEAGLEEALTHLYYNMGNLGTNGWTYENGLFKKERYLGTDRYIVTITSNSAPEIVARGYVRVPLGTNFITPPRAVRITTTNEGLFVRGMVAKNQIDLSGNNVATDSFDSSNPAYSTGGRYDPAKARDNGHVATNSGLTNSLNVGNADIHGHAATGPGGAPSIGPNGGIGPKAWRDAGNNGIYSGWFTDDMNVSFPDVSAPFSGGAFIPESGTYGGTNYTYLVGDGNWRLSSLSMSGNSKKVLLVTGKAVLYVTGDVSLSGSSSIRIASGASLKLYVAGANADLSGNGIINENTSATNFWYYGLPSNTSLALKGNATFTGIIYAPSADFTLGGGGNTIYDFVGASVTSSVKMNGHFNFHYDELIGRIGPSRGFIVTSWNEIAWTGN